MVLEKTLESPLDCKEIQPVNPEGKSTLNIHWKDCCWSWGYNTLATWCEESTHWKRHWCWERLRAGGEGGNRGWDGWMALSFNGHVYEQTLGDSGGRWRLACCSPRGRKELDTPWWLNSNTMFTAALSIAAKRQKQSNCPSTDEWINKWCCVCVCICICNRILLS